MRPKIWVFLLCFCVLFKFSPTLEARIKLATLPVRDRVEIQLDNDNATLVEEERIVTLLKGGNKIDFSWSNTQIDKETILFRPLEIGNAVRVIHVSYPPNENALVWEVYADAAGPVRVRISYLLGNLRRSFSYRATATEDEKSLTLRNYLKAANFSGEEFGTAGVWAGFGETYRKEMGLQESKEMLLTKFSKVPMKKKFLFNWQTGKPVPEEPNQRYVSMHYVFKNDTQNKLGKYPLPPGKFRIFQLDGHGGDAFLGEDWGLFTPIDEEVKLFLGLARDIKVERTIAKNERNNTQYNLYNQNVVIQYKIQSFKKDACLLDIEEDLSQLRDQLCGGKDHDVQWKLAGKTTDKMKIERISTRNLEIHIPLPSRPKAADAKPKEITFLLNVIFENEW